MRTIDADTLRERLQSLAYDDWNQGITTSFADACHEIIDIIEEQPTIEPSAESERLTDDDFETKMQDLEQAEIQKAYELGKLDAMEEIVRCKDCKHKHIENSVFVCPFGLPGGPEFFCGYGAERREE